MVGWSADECSAYVQVEPVNRRFASTSIIPHWVLREIAQRLLLMMRLGIRGHISSLISAVERAGLRGLAEGQKISYEVEADRRSGKESAVDLKTV
jgi:hypothetical protein